MMRSIPSRFLLTLCALAAALAFGADISTLPETLRPLAEQLNGEGVQTRIDAINALAASGDPSVLPFLAEAMDEAAPAENPDEVENVRAAATLAVATAFPDQAVELFGKLLREGSPGQREAASYGLGHLDGARALQLALTMLESDDPALRKAASTAILRRGRTASTAAQFNVYHISGREPMSDEEFAERTLVLDTITGRIERDPASPGSPIYRVVHQLGDSRTAAALVEAYCARIESSSPELAALLRKVHRVNSRWLGRPTPPPVAAVDYRLEMDNLADPTEPYGQQVTFGPREFEVLYFRETRPDRGTRASFPLDTLMTYPQATSPRLTGSDGKIALLEYQVPPFTGVDVSIGIPMVIEAWRGSVGAQRGVVRIDTERGVPLLDKLYGADGNLVAQVEFADYAEIAGGSLVPRFIEIRARTPNHGWLRYDLHYQIAEPGVWILSHGEGYQGTANGEELRAVVKLLGLQITPLPVRSAG